MGPKGSVKITGDWTLSQAPERLELLRGEFLRLQQESPAAAGIDLGAVTEIDACGSQLILLFLENLRRAGIRAVCTGATGEAAATIRQLGYLGLLGEGENGEGHDPRR